LEKRNHVNPYDEGYCETISQLTIRRLKELCGYIIVRNHKAKGVGPKPLELDDKMLELWGPRRHNCLSGTGGHMHNKPDKLRRLGILPNKVR
jgi:hypothetical protein